MTNPFAGELVRRMAPRLRVDYAVEGALPLDMSTLIERLRVIDVVRAEGARGNLDGPPLMLRETITLASHAIG